MIVYQYFVIDIDNYYGIYHGAGPRADGMIDSPSLPPRPKTPVGRFYAPSLLPHGIDPKSFHVRAAQDTQSAWTWCASCCVILGALIATSAIVASSSSAAGLETVWLVPSLCRFQQDVFVSYVDETVAPLSHEGYDYDTFTPTLGTACPAHLQHSTAQAFTLVEDLGWAAPGFNESLVVFHGETDHVVLSFTLTDAHGAVLLSEQGARIEGTESMEAAAEEATVGVVA